MGYYMHHVSGRLRIKTPAVKRNNAAGHEIKNMLSTMSGIFTIYINLTTGSILIHYDPNTLHYQEIIALLHEQGYFDVSKVVTKSRNPGMSASRAGKLVGEVALSILVDKTLGGPVISIITVLLKAVAGK